MSKRNNYGYNFERSECVKNNWISLWSTNHAKFSLSDAIAVKFNPKSINNYNIQSKPFVIKCDAIDNKGVPIEIKKNGMVDGNTKLTIPFSEYLSIKSYRDVYKLICEKYLISYIIFNGGKRNSVCFDGLYQKFPQLLTLEKLKSIDRLQKKQYYRDLYQFCISHGVTEMFNTFVGSNEIKKIFHSWIQNFKRKNFYVDCQSGIYHSSDLNFNIKLIKGYWGFDRITVFIKLKNNV